MEVGSDGRGVHTLLRKEKTLKVKHWKSSRWKLGFHSSVFAPCPKLPKSVKKISEGCFRFWCMVQSSWWVPSTCCGTCSCTLTAKSTSLERIWHDLETQTGRYWTNHLLCWCSACAQQNITVGGPEQVLTVAGWQPCSLQYLDAEVPRLNTILYRNICAMASAAMIIKKSPWIPYCNQALDFWCPSKGKSRNDCTYRCLRPELKQCSWSHGPAPRQVSAGGAFGGWICLHLCWPLGTQRDNSALQGLGWTASQPAEGHRCFMMICSVHGRIHVWSLK